jgi:two-component system sensor histidine kinase ChiS
VKTALNGEEAFVQIRDDRPNLVILDVVMPRMGGLELMLKLQSELAAPLPPILLCSGSDLTVEEALRRGASSFLRKPLARDELLATVAGLLERQSP